MISSKEQEHGKENCQKQRRWKTVSWQIPTDMTVQKWLPINLFHVTVI